MLPVQDDALQEVEEAVTHIVVPLRQAVELLPRAAPVVEAQRRLVERYGLRAEVVGAGGDVRVRVLPAVPAAKSSADVAAGES
eukprot:354258-Chlamydomonas_euryale.AAC.1